MVCLYIVSYSSIFLFNFRYFAHLLDFSLNVLFLEMLLYLVNYFRCVLILISNYFQQFIMFLKFFKCYTSILIYFIIFSTGTYSLTHTSFKKYIAWFPHVWRFSRYIPEMDFEFNSTIVKEHTLNHFDLLMFVDIF